MVETPGVSSRPRRHWQPCASPSRWASSRPRCRRDDDQRCSPRIPRWSAEPGPGHAWRNSAGVHRHRAGVAISNSVPCAAAAYRRRWGDASSLLLQRSRPAHGGQRGTAIPLNDLMIFTETYRAAGATRLWAARGADWGGRGAVAPFDASKRFRLRLDAANAEDAAPLLANLAGWSWRRSVRDEGSLNLGAMSRLGDDGRLPGEEQRRSNPRAARRLLCAAATDFSMVISLMVIRTASLTAAFTLEPEPASGDR